ncbi:hypothetical protein CH368_20580, partial [Leptospira levettii]
MEESIKLTGKLAIDRKQFDQTLQNLPKDTEKAFSKMSGSVGKFFQSASKSLPNQNKKQNVSTVAKAGNFARDNTYQGGDIASNIDTQGSLYSMVRGDIEASRGAYKSVADKYKATFGKKKLEDQNTSGGEQTGSPSLPLGQNLTKQTIQNASFQIANAKFDGKALPTSASQSTNPGAGTLPGAGGGGSGIEGGGMMTKVGGTMGIVGGVVLAAAGATLKMISDVADRYEQAMSKQSGTIGSLGGYVGGGGGYATNSELAQSMVASGKVTGEDVYGKKSSDFGIDKDL